MVLTMKQFYVYVNGVCVGVRSSSYAASLLANRKLKDGANMVSITNSVKAT